MNFHLFLLKRFLLIDLTEGQIQTLFILESASVHFYKEASSFKNQFAKNNLGVIYKNGFENPQNFELAKTYYIEAINQKNDKVSMFNLACIYLNNKIEKNKSIELLIHSTKQGFYPSKVLLCLALINEFGLDYDKMKIEISNYISDSKNVLIELKKVIKDKKLDNSQVFNELFCSYKAMDFLYDYAENIISSKYFLSKDKEQIGQNMNISCDFYTGFGIDLI